MNKKIVASRHSFLLSMESWNLISSSPFSWVASHKKIVRSNNRINKQFPYIFDLWHWSSVKQCRRGWLLVWIQYVRLCRSNSQIKWQRRATDDTNIYLQLKKVMMIRDIHCCLGIDCYNNDYKCGLLAKYKYIFASEKVMMIRNIHCCLGIDNTLYKLSTVSNIWVGWALTLQYY